CSLVGTSTNLVVNGLLLAQTDIRLGLFDVAWIGLPCTLLGIAYVLGVSHWLLPDRQRAVTRHSDPREYTVEMIMDSACPLAGKSIEDAGLRQLPGLYLAEIGRDGRVLPAVGPQEILRAGDRLVFVGVVESVVELQKIRGLVPAPDQVFKLDMPRPKRLLVEAVVSDSCPMVGKSIREGRFRTRYNAVVIAASRNGERLKQKLGDVVLRAGDTLLMEAGPAFAEQQRNSRDFYLVSPVENSRPPRHERALLAAAILAGMVLVVALGWLSMLQASLLAAGLMLVSRCVTGSAARRSVDWQVLIVIASSIGLGTALETTGAAATIAQQLVGLAAGNAWLSLAAIYALTTLFTELITNTGAAVLMFPIALAASSGLGVSFAPFAITVMMAASFGFASPIGYQTHLMVYGPGGYRFADYLRIGLPLDVLMGIVTVGLAPLVWPF
ncbi:MAG TPA: SLC13 family permease, partial [Trueperaceae bacterium]